MPQSIIKKEKREWWKEAVFYQIYPRSFLDTSGDGNGDLKGVIKKLDYLKDLGIGAIWISPIYASPMADNGYDISDYYAVNPMFGSMEDFELLLDGIHKRGMRLMMDLVVNHTSIEHPWFLESGSSRENPKRDWYIWRDGKNGQEPNNWASHFMSSAWEWDERTKQYYLHLFSKEQADLNWNNPEVKKEIFKMAGFWLSKGVDAFRMDMANYIMKAEGLPDAPRNNRDSRRYIHGEGLYANQAGMHELIRELKNKVLKPYGAVLFGEMYFLDPDTALEYVAYDKKEFDLTYQYEIVGARGDWKKAKESISLWYEKFKNKGWNSITFSNHDSPRPVSVFGDLNYHKESAECLATFLLTAPGTPFFLQGEEVGMTNVEYPDLSAYSDIEMKMKFKERVDCGEDPYWVFKDLVRWSRDNARTPMQWNGGRNAGFSEGTPWLGINPNYEAINVENNLSNPDSILNYYKKLISARRDHDALVYGDYIPLTPHDWETYAYRRQLGESSFLIILNTSPRQWNMEILKDLKAGYDLFLSNYVRNDLEESVLRPWEARIYRR
jgi:glycosidase